MSKGGGGGGDQTTVQEPWSEQRPFLRQGFGAAESLLRNPPEVYTGRRIAPQSGLTTEAINRTARDARGTVTRFGRDVAGASRDAMNVDVLGNEQYQDLAGDIEQRGRENLFESILPRIREQAAGAGAYGGSDMDRLMSRGIEDTQDATSSALASLGGQFYQTDVGARSAAISTAPGVLSTLTAPSSLLGAAGQAVDKRQQAELTDSIGTFEALQQAPETALDRFIARTRGNIGGTSTTSMPDRTTGQRVGDAVTGGVGGYLTGSSLASSLGLTGPWGAIGAGVGGLLGLL